MNLEFNISLGIAIIEPTNENTKFKIPINNKK